VLDGDEAAGVLRRVRGHDGVGCRSRVDPTDRVVVGSPRAIDRCRPGLSSRRTVRHEPASAITAERRDLTVT
jgi:hypothetical protein